MPFVKLMRQLSKIRLLIALTVGIVLFGFPVLSADYLKLPQGLRLQAWGTGETTGEVIDIRVSNAGSQRIIYALGPLLIPSADSTQGYCIPHSYEIDLAPGMNRNLTLVGYCTNPYLPPARKGGSLADISQWAQTVDKDLSNEVLMQLGNGFKPIAEELRDTLSFAFPGTGIPVDHTIAIDDFPVDAAPMVVAAALRMESCFDTLKVQGLMRTPISDEPDKEHVSVVQHAFWIGAGLLRGEKYQIDHFANSLVSQLEQVRSQAYSEFPEPIKTQLSEGIAEFWNVFLEVALHAEVIVQNP